MTSTSPYKSKLFNFLNRQSIQWNTRLAQAARRLKITVEWGSQIAVYPLYLLVQSSRVATRQFAASRSKKQKEQQAIAQTSDSAVTSDMTSEILALNASDSSDVKLQGLACDLTSQQIFFVDQQNQLVIPDQSQESLQKQISLELGNFNYQKRRDRQTALPPQEPRILPPVQPQNPTLFAPVRWALQGLSWLEQSPVAIALDFFGESNWRTAVVPLEIYSPKLFPPLPLEPILTPLDDRVAALETKLLNSDVDFTSESDLPPLKRFFRRFTPKPAATDEPQTTESPSSSPESTPTDQQSWLSWTDLFKPKTNPANLPSPSELANTAIVPTTEQSQSSKRTAVESTEPELPPLQRFFRKFSPNPITSSQPLTPDSPTENSTTELPAEKSQLSWTDLFKPKTNSANLPNPSELKNTAIVPTTEESSKLTAVENTESELPPLQRFLRKFTPNSITSDQSQPSTPDPLTENSTTEPPAEKSWLSWTDLFKSQAKTVDSTDQRDTAIIPTPEITSDVTSFVALNTELTTEQEEGRSPDLTPANNIETNELATVKTETTTDLTNTSNDSPEVEIEAQPEWIETEALSAGYEYHFLEKLLKKVDQIMVWVEETIAKIWSKFR
ncbi:hypothetical protein Lepto7376_3393 [[Leptolyngbya] sp. PCC 7376]|uniref:hypothetical protein n=1 Tax=[Leptolyngbya] sp. PCC 7376 TaxID=111781 RepID=UPI00029F2752|nr:hypothetical protein [[Leptolyngbya] sp. PCC 7376]AFY39602.1 hypothetical protein Lepto7376_3393 [[Leptolyngbya] sp. PCC 7376]